VALWDRGGAVRTAEVADRRAPEADGTMAVTLPDRDPHPLSSVLPPVLELPGVASPPGVLAHVVHVG
jgi:hypothetical protein